MDALIKLRALRIEDANALHANCWPDKTLSAVCSLLGDILRRQRRGLSWGIVALIDGQPVAFGQLSRWGKIAEISDLIVGENWRGYGVGTVLIERLLIIAASSGIEEVEIGAREQNTRALTLYRRLGFTQKRRIMMEFGNGPEPVIYLAQRIEEVEGA